MSRAGCVNTSAATAIGILIFSDDTAFLSYAPTIIVIAVTIISGSKFLHSQVRFPII
jgi:hypothetical protein